MSSLTSTAPGTTSPVAAPGHDVVLGMGGCVDYELRLDAATLQRLAAAMHITAADIDHQGPIRDERDLVVSILGHLRSGTGGEHFVADSDVLKRFANRFTQAVTLGGTSVRAGIVMARLGISPLLHLVNTNQHIRSLLPDGVDWISSSTHDTLHPHLIVQYVAGLQIHTELLDVVAPVANRLIYVNDPDNETLLLRQDLGQWWASARVVLLSGFNAIRDPDVLDARLVELRRHLDRLPPDALVHFEDAAYHEPALSRQVREAVLDRVHTFGLNEDELQGFLTEAVDLTNPPAVVAALERVHTLVPTRNLVLHTASWSAVRGPDADRLAPALDAGMAVASLRFAAGDDWTPEQLTILAAGPRDPTATALAVAVEQLAGGCLRCRPGFQVKTDQPTTVGLGDSFVGGFLAQLAVEHRR